MTEKQLFIEELAYNVRQVYNLPTPLGRPKDFVEKIGGVIVKTVSINNREIDVAKTNDTFTIYIPDVREENPDTTREICSCLGDLFLHMGYQTSSKLWRFQENGKIYHTKSVEEQFEANQFGDALLMPKEHFRKKLKDTLRNHNDVDEVSRIMAHYYGVPQFAIIARGKQLGFFESKDL